jgi:hypothetical protein
MDPLNEDGARAGPNQRLARDAAGHKQRRPQREDGDRTEHDARRHGNGDARHTAEQVLGPCDEEREE